MRRRDQHGSQNLAAVFWAYYLRTRYVAAQRGYPLCSVMRWNNWVAMGSYNGSSQLVSVPERLQNLLTDELDLKNSWCFDMVVVNFVVAVHGLVLIHVVTTATIVQGCSPTHPPWQTF